MWTKAARDRSHNAGLGGRTRASIRVASSMLAGGGVHSRGCHEYGSTERWRSLEPALTKISLVLVNTRRLLGNIAGRYIPIRCAGGAGTERQVPFLPVPCNLPPPHSAGLRSGPSLGFLVHSAVPIQQAQL